MTKAQKEAIKNKAQLVFMVATLNSLHPNHCEYPYEILKSIEKSNSIDILDGTIYSNELFRGYADYILECFIMKRMIEIFSGKEDFFGVVKTPKTEHQTEKTTILENNPTQTNK